MSKIAGEINAEMMHPKVIHAQRKELFVEMVRKTGSQQYVMDRMLQEIQFLRDHEGGPMDEEVIDILRGNVASLERQRDQLKADAVRYRWHPIETAPKGELIAIWIVGTNKNGQKWSDEEGECWLYCYHDNICGDWRTTRPSGHLRCVPDRFVTHWMPLPNVPAIDIAITRGEE